MEMNAYRYFYTTRNTQYRALTLYYMYNNSIAERFKFSFGSKWFDRASPNLFKRVNHNASKGIQRKIDLICCQRRPEK